MTDKSDRGEHRPHDLASLAAFARSGQDKEAVTLLYDLLLDDLAPDNLIERLWIRDLAVLTIRSEELRLIQVAVHKLLMERGSGDRSSEAGSPLCAGGPAPAPTLPPCPTVAGNSHETALALTYAENVALIDKLAAMEADVRRDRDRVISTFDLRRSIAVRAVLDAMAEAVKG